MNENGQYLYHHGILGQRWGVRRTEKQLNAARGKQPIGKQSTARRVNDDDPVKTMTKEELESVVRRMELEKRYRDLNPKQVSRGKQFTSSVINKVITPAVTDASKQLLKDYLIKQGQEALKIKDKK